MLGAIAPLDGALAGARGAFQPAQADRTPVLGRIAGHVRGLERRQFFQGEPQRIEGGGVGPEDLLAVCVVENDAQRHGFDQGEEIVGGWQVHRAALAASETWEWEVWLFIPACAWGCAQK
ncbi:hypothetical protein D3C73_1015320 [compost metagenome]